MKNEQETGESTALNCPVCHAVVAVTAESLIRFTRASFPEELEATHLTALGGTDMVKCPVCGHLLKKPSLGLCVIQPLGRGLLYIPPEVEKLLPNRNLAEEVRQGWQENGHPASSLELFSDLLTFQRKVYHYGGNEVPKSAEE